VRIDRRTVQAVVTFTMAERGPLTRAASTESGCQHSALSLNEVRDQWA
jgi:hypothetical protein